MLRPRLLRLMLRRRRVAGGPRVVKLGGVAPTAARHQQRVEEADGERVVVRHSDEGEAVKDAVNFQKGSEAKRESDGGTEVDQ